MIGAGAAGLAAARSLGGRSLRVVVLEARDRIGGRVWSLPVARAATPAELGAEFIHGSAENTMTLLRETGATTLGIGDESWTRENGRLHRDDGDFLSAAALLRAARSLGRDESVDEFLRRYESDGAAARSAKAARAFVEGFDAADPAIASARAIAEELSSGVDSKSARPLGGYGAMFEHLRDACIAAGVHIRLSTTVRRVSRRGRAVTVDALDGAGRSQRIQARTAIVTLPVGVLRHSGDESEIAFDPELPAAKREALRCIEMGCVVKIVLKFRTAFWERLREGRYRDGGFFRMAGRPFAAYWTQLPVRSELIVAWAGGPKAIALNGTSKADLIERALEGFGNVFDEPRLAREEFEGGFMHDWSGDTFARGAYSYLAVGGAGARATLAAPLDGALFFAGEATSSGGEGGTVNGALETGERAAAQVAATLDA